MKNKETPCGGSLKFKREAVLSFAFVEVRGSSDPHNGPTPFFSEDPNTKSSPQFTD